MTAPRVRRQQRSRRNVRMARLSRPWLESLERRVVLSSVSWINPNGGDWDTASNWSSDAIPTAAADVTISIAVSNPITHSSSRSDFVDSITSSDPIVLSGGSLSIANASTFSSNLTISGGVLSLAGVVTAPNLTMSGGTLTGPGTLSAASQVTWTGGTLSGPLTNAGTITVAGTGYEGLTGTLTNTGTIADTGSGWIYPTANGVTITNQAGAVFDFQGNAWLFYYDPYNSTSYSGLTFNNQPRPEAVVLGRPPEGADYVRLPPLGAWSWSGPSFLPGTGRGFSVDDDFQAYPLSCESLPKP